MKENQIIVAKMFIRQYLEKTDKDYVKNVNFETLRKYDKSFLDKGCRDFIRDILHSIDVKGELTYFYVVREFDGNISEVLYDEIVNDCIKHIILWHRKSNRLTSDDNDPKVIPFRFRR